MPVYAKWAIIAACAFGLRLVLASIHRIIVAYLTEVVDLSAADELCYVATEHTFVVYESVSMQGTIILAFS